MSIMLRERLYPLYNETFAGYLVGKDSHPTWVVHGGEFYKGQVVKTGFIGIGHDIPLMELCTYSFNDLDKTYEIDTNIGIVSVLVQVKIAGVKYMGTVDINRHIDSVTPYPRGERYHGMDPGLTVNFTHQDPKIEGFVIRDLPIDINFDRTKNELTFHMTSIGCVSVVGVQLDLHVISNQH